jgi:ATP-dependent helicase/nuclease subunit A
MSERQWTTEQLLAITTRDRELAVGAAAGSGKTAVLIERVVRAALGQSSSGTASKPVELDRMLIVTFTRSAAAELRSRLHSALATELAERREAGQDTIAIREQLALLPAARISTIHSFCSAVIRSHGHSAGISLSRLLTEDEARLVRHELAGNLLDGLLARDDEFGNAIRELALAWGGSEGVGRDDISGGERGSSLRRSVLKLADFLRSLEDPEQWWTELASVLALDPDNCDPQHPLLQALEGILKTWASEVLRQDELTAQRLSAAYPGAVFLQLIARRRPILAGLSLSRGWEDCARQLLALREKQADISYKPDLLTSYARDLDRDDDFTKVWLQNRNKRIADDAKSWLEYLERPWEEVASRENQARALLHTLYAVTRELLDHYADYKSGRALMDFGDLEHGAFEILALRDADGRLQRDPHGELLPTDIALELRSQLQLIMVDEYQDTNPLQNAILRLVTPAPVNIGRPSCVVGDVKQSIYAFRLATPGLFSDRLRELGSGRPDGLALTLNRNFRSRRSIVEGINTIFSGLLTEDFGGQDYSANRLIYGANYDNADSPGLLGSERKPGLHLVYNDTEEAEAEGLATQRLVYRRVAAVLRSIHAEGQMITDSETGQARRVAWGDMVVLLRSVSGRSEALLSELERAGVPAYAPGRSGFYERPEVSDALALLRVIDNPLADIALATVLSGPALGLDVNELALLGSQDRDAVALPLWERLQSFLREPPPAMDELCARLRDFLARLEVWRSEARNVPLGQLLWQLYHEAGILPSAAALERGGQRVANLTVLHSMAQGFERSERQGLARFLHFLEHNRRSAGDLGEAPLLSEAQDVVRVMTVHQAKGLEFPVVILPDIHRRFNMQDLGNDVIWERSAGIGGRFVNLRGNDPLRSETLGRLISGQALRNQMAAEELRILYVALTRTRERLELVASVRSDFADKISDSHPGSQASSWLDWIAPQLAGLIQPAQFSGGNTWQLFDSEPALPEDDNALPHDAWDETSLQAALQRVAWHNPHAPLATLPRKLAVTEIERLLQAPQDADTDELTAAGTALDEPEPEPADPAPAPRFEYDPVARAAAMRYGSAMHLLMAHVDLLAAPDERELEELVQRLLAEGLLDEALAAELDRPGILRCLRDLQASGLLQGAALHRELPVSMSLPAAGLGLLPEGLAAPIAAAAGNVIVQGTLDLLLVYPGRVVVLDYKTDRRSAPRLLAHHHSQLAWYCRMASAMLPEHTVQWALYGFAGAGLLGPFDMQA